jgi:hypothetical protein
MTRSAQVPADHADTESMIRSAHKYGQRTIAQWNAYIRAARTLAEAEARGEAAIRAGVSFAELLPS